jgi:ribosomal protein S18 acetylase RimI-like enzyme
LIGRLARDLAFKGCGLGDLLLLDALRRALRHARDIPAVVVVVDPKDLGAVAFYKRNGFQPLDERRMFVSMTELKQWEAQGWKS